MARIQALNRVIIQGSGATTPVVPQQAVRPEMILPEASRELLASRVMAKPIGRWIPAGATVRTFKPEALVLDDKEELVRGGNHRDRRDMYAEVIDRLSKMMGARFDTQRLDVRDVLYPCGGTEAYLPFALFPGATDVVMVDAMPFLRQDHLFGLTETIDRFSDPLHSAKFRHINDVQKDKYLAARLVPSLLSLGSSARIEKIEVFSEPGASPGPGTAVNGVIHFDIGDGVKRRLVVLNRKIPSVKQEFDVSKFDFLRDCDPTKRGAMIVKASSNTLGKEHLNPVLRQKLVEWLRLKRGFLIEGYSAASYEMKRDGIPLGFEFSERLAFGGSHAEFADYPRGRVEYVPFGYFMNAMVTLFDKRKL